MASVNVASTNAVWEAAQKLAEIYGGPRGVEKAASSDPSVLDVLALPKPTPLPQNFKVLIHKQLLSEIQIILFLL